MRLSPLLAALLLSGIACAAHAADIGVVGLFPGKAVLVIDDAAPKTYSVGTTTPGGVRLIAVSQTGATVEVDGKRQTIAMGEHINRAPAGGMARTVLQADGRGHFIAQGQINGGSVRMLVDTGASYISLPAVEAARLGIDYKKGQIGYANTANGTVPVYRVRLDRVKVGEIDMNQIDATVHESGLPIILLGMSFLNRTEMRREGEQMTLIKRY